MTNLENVILTKLVTHVYRDVSYSIKANVTGRDFK